MVLSLAFGATFADEAQEIQLSLPEALLRAFSSSLPLRIAENEERRAALQGVTASSYNLPEVSIFSSFTYLEPRPGVKKDLLPFAPPLELNIGRNDNFSHGLQARYMLYDGGRREHMNRAASLMIEAAKWSLVDKKRTVEYEVRRAFLMTLFAHEMESLAGENLERTRVRLSQAETAFSSGTIPRVDLLRAKSEEADASASLDDSRLNHASIRRQLGLLLDLTGPITPAGSLESAALNLDSVDTAALRSQNPEFARLAAASLSSQAQQENAQSRAADLMPTVTMGVRAAQTNPYRGEVRYGPDLNAFVQINYPIFDAGRGRASYEAAKLEAENMALQTAEAERTMRAYYAQLLDKIESLKRTLAARRTGIDRARASREAAHAAWKSGAIDLARMVDADTALTKSQVDYYRTVAELYEGLADWERWSGVTSGAFAFFDK